MKKRYFALLLSFSLLAATFMGCRPSFPSSETSAPEESVNKAQMVVAMNPVLKFGSSNVIAYNDLKNSIESDGKAASLVSMLDDTDWRWGYRQANGWKGQAIYALSKWKSGTGASSGKVPNAYSFSADGTISVASYATQVTTLTAYQNGEVPGMGILISVSGDREETLYYTVAEDGHMTIPAGTITAVELVDGVKTDFLLEDGSPRSAVVRIIVNSCELWSGQLANSAASPNGVAKTELSYPSFEDISVSQGDLVFISFELDATINANSNVSMPLDSNPNYSSDTSSGFPSKQFSILQPKDEHKTISLVDGYDSRFVIISEVNASAEMLQQAAALRAGMVKALETDQGYSTDELVDTGNYEILIGLTNRPQSAAIMQELTGARTNYATDYIIRMVDKKLVLAAANEFSMSLAVKYFLENYCNDDKASVPSNLNIVYRPALQNVMLGNNNIASFTLRTEKYPSYITVLAAQDLQRQIMRKTGYRIPIGKDTENSTCEIMLGPSTNDTVNLVTGKQDLPQNLLANINDYEISLSGNRMTIKGGSTTAVNEAVQAFTAEMETKTGFPDGYFKNGSYNPSEYSLSAGYGLMWSDDFNGSALMKRWHQDTETLATFDGTTMIKNAIFGEDYFLRDGYLVQTTRKRKNEPGYNVARMTTENLMNFRYGYLEVRLIMPTNNGACGAVWMEGKGLNQVDYAEIDLNENYGIDAYQPNMHSWPTNTATGGAHWQMWEHDANNYLNEKNWVFPVEGEHFYDTFHYLGMEWTKDYIAFYLDGQITKFVDLTSAKYDVLEQSVVLKLGTMVANNMGYGLNGKGIPPYFMDDVSGFYEESIFDYVRIYQKNDSQYKLKEKG